MLHLCILSRNSFSHVCEADYRRLWAPPRSSSELLQSWGVLLPTSKFTPLSLVFTAATMTLSLIFLHSCHFCPFEECQHFTRAIARFPKQKWRCHCNPVPFTHDPGLWRPIGNGDIKYSNSVSLSISHHQSVTNKKCSILDSHEYRNIIYLHYALIIRVLYHLFHSDYNGIGNFNKKAAHNLPCCVYICCSLLPSLQK